MNIFKIASLVLVFTLTLVSASEYETISWKDLEGKKEIYDNPFERLSKEQHYYISVYARLVYIEKNKPYLMNPAMKEEKITSAQWLQDNGIDVDKLLKQREHIIKMREKEASAINLSLDKKSIELSGYLLPFKFNDKKVTEFLLVPLIFGLDHDAHLSPNQTVYVKVDEPVLIKKKFESFRIKGVITHSKHDHNITLIDETEELTSLYFINASDVSVYKNKSKE